MAENTPAVANSPMKNKQEPDAGVLGEVAGDELGLGDRHVERCVWVSSACTAIRKMTNPMNWVRMNGLPMPPQPKISPSAWAMTMPCMFMVPAWMTTPTTARTSGSS